jgi:hypothetical protein
VRLHAADAVIEAHGIGGQADLPIPLSLAISGAVAALVLSFAVLILAWRNPRYDRPGRPGEPARAGRPAPLWLDRAVRARATAVALRVVGMAIFLFAVVSAIFGEDALTNPFFGIFYVWWWVGLVFASALVGPVWRAISPVRTINALLALLSGADPDRGLRDYPARLGVWPAALGLYAFVWLELVYEHSASLGPVRLWAAVYVAIMLVGGALFGARFYAYADPFEVWSTLAAKVSPWAIEDDRLVLRSPLANLATITPVPGLVAVVAVLFGSTAFDSFSESSFWVRTVQNAELTQNVLDNGALLVFCLGAAAVFSVGCLLAGVTVVGGRLRGVELGVPRRDLPRWFAHALVPILVGYFVAHYLTLFVDTGIQTLSYVSDPFGEGWNLFGTAALEPSYWFSYHPTLLATVKVLAVVVGHVAAAVSAHDRAIAILPRDHQVSGQLPLLVAMVVFTAGGLYLLFNA